MPEYDGWYIADDHAPEGNPDNYMVLVGECTPMAITDGVYSAEDGWRFNLWDHRQMMIVPENIEHWRVLAWKKWELWPDALNDELEKRYFA